MTRRRPGFFGPWMLIGFAVGGCLGLLATDLQVSEYVFQGQLQCDPPIPFQQTITQVEVRYAGYRVLRMPDGGERIENLLFAWHVRSFGIFVCAWLGVGLAYVAFRLCRREQADYGTMRRAAQAA